MRKRVFRWGAGLSILTGFTLFSLTVGFPIQGNAGETVTLVVEVSDAGDDLSYVSSESIGSRSPSYYEAGSSWRQAADVRRWRVIEVAVDEVDGVREELEADPDVKEVDEEKLYYEAVIPNDTHYGLQYGLASNGLRGIHAPEAWDVTKGSSDTVIAIIDGGVDLEHEDLKEKIWVNGGEVADNGIDDDGNGYVDDIHGWDFVSDQPAKTAIDHGTHVAGIAAASGNNGVGVAGVDWGARIMSIRALSFSGVGRETSIIRSIEYAVANGADVINMSLVGTRSEALAAAVENAYASGVIVVAAVGNYGIDTGIRSVYPACADAVGVNTVIGVGATDEEGEPTSFSNYGSCVDISAPGDDILSTEVGDDYDTKTGTSMSSPFVAGTAGLYKSLHPNASPAEVIAAVTNGDAFTGEDEDEWNRDFGGKLNAALVVGGNVSSDNSEDNLSDTSPEDVPDDSSDSSSEDKTSEENVSDEGSEKNTNNSLNSDSGGGGGGSDSGGGGGGGEGDCCAHDDEKSQISDSKSGRVAGSQTVRANVALIPKINAAFRQVFGRNPIVTEHGYWLGRVKRGEKRSFGALVGAMAWQKAHGWTWVPSVSRLSSVAGATSDTSLISKINSLHRLAWGRNPTVSEHQYWMGRVVAGDKTSESALLGAMVFHRVVGIVH